MTDRALSFGSAAADYHHFRPGYPDELVNRVLAHASVPVTRALEVGAGTGKATAAFAGRGFSVVAVEPDPEMRAVLSSQIDAGGWPVSLVAGTFESVDPAALGPFDLLYAAASFHWTDPGTRWARAAALVRPGGAIALFGAMRDLADEGLRATVDDLTPAATQHDPSSSWTVDVLRDDPAFTDVVETDFSHVAPMPADDYVAHLSTLSGFIILPPGERAEALGAIRAALPDVVDVRQIVPVHLARRTEES